MSEGRRMPPLNALRAFEAAARHLSFKAAAAELFVTPAAISHQIRNLEELVGFKLFERTGTSIVLTRAGERFFPVLRDGFDRIAQSVIDLQREEDALTISVTQAFAAMILIPQLMQLRKLHPGIVLTVNASEKVIDLRKFEADLAVRYGPERTRPMRSQLLFRDRYIAVASPAWVGTQALPVAAQKLTQSELLGYQWKNSTLKGPGWIDWMELAGIKGYDVGRAIAFSEESHAIQAAVDGAGVALASSVLVGPTLRAGRLVQVHPLGLQGFAYHAEYLEDHPRLNSIEKVVNWLAGLAGSMDGSDEP
jgi:LysR family transcriptional regulator, glycine cleavage system transcriptional activator